MRNALPALVILLALCACSSGLGDTMLAQADKEYTQGNYLKAEALYEQYIQANPQGEGRWEAWNRLVEISTTITGNHKKAASLLEAMQLEYSDDQQRTAHLAWNLAETYSTLHDWDRAAETWQALLDQPGQAPEQIADIYWNLGKIYQYQGRYGMAKDAMLACMDKAPKGPKNARCMYELAQAYSLLKNRDQAKSWLQKLVDQQDTDTEIHALAAYLLSELLEAEGQTDQARTLLESIRTTYPNPMVIVTRLKQLGK